MSERSKPSPERAPNGTPVTTASSLPLRVAALSTRRANWFHLRPDATARAALAAELDLLALRKLDFKGAIGAAGTRDWRLEGRLGATVVQPCVISAEPVSTRIDVAVSRVFSASGDLAAPTTEPATGPAYQAETQMPEDDRIEPLTSEIDPGAVMTEALALALPDYPRKPGAALGDDGVLAVVPPGAEPIPEKPENPFAALAALRRGDGRNENGT